jgi:hypothetical protein
MADNIATTQTDLINRLRNGLPVGYTDAKVKKPNAKFNTPKNSKWLRITVVPFETESDAATGACKITRGLCVVDVFYPQEVGDKAQLLDVQTIRELYENQTFGNTHCQEASINTIGEDGSLYTVQININFYMTGFSQ